MLVLVLPILCHHLISHFNDAGNPILSDLRQTLGGGARTVNDPGKLGWQLAGETEILVPKVCIDLVEQ